MLKDLIYYIENSQNILYGQLSIKCGHGANKEKLLATLQYVIQLKEKDII